MAIEKKDKITSFALKESEKRMLADICDKLSVGMSEYIRIAVMNQVKKDMK